MNTMLMMMANIILSTLLISIALWLPQTYLYTEKACPYECGFDPISSARLPFSMKFFLVGITFLLFDLEIALLLPIPWAMQYSNTNMTTTISFVLVSILTLGLIYEWLNKGLEWTE